MSLLDSSVDSCRVTRVWLISGTTRCDWLQLGKKLCEPGEGAPGDTCAESEKRSEDRGIFEAEVGGIF
jgi:hypothetical protein